MKLPGCEMEELEVGVVKAIKSGNSGNVIRASTDRSRSMVYQCWRGRTGTTSIAAALSLQILSRTLCMSGNTYCSCSIQGRKNAFTSEPRL